MITKKQKEEAYNFHLFERSARSQVADDNRQHKVQIDLNDKNTKKEQVDEWLNDPTKSDIKGIDDISKERIQILKYGSIRTKAEKKALNKIRKINARRPSKVLEKDLSSNEPIVELTSWKKWNNNKKKYDIKGVDTIPEGILGEVSNRIRKKYIPDVKRQKYNRGQNISTLGYFAYGKTPKLKKERNYIRINRLIKGDNPQQSKTLTHEIGHSFDYNVLGKKRKLKSDNFKGGAFEQMKRLALKEKPISPGANARFKAYRLQKRELFADAFTGFIRDPKKAKKEAPLFTKLLKGKSKSFNRDIFKYRKEAVKKRVKIIKKRSLY